MKKKILMIASYFPPCGGVGVFRITKFAKYLKYYGYDPIIVTMDSCYYPSNDNSLLEDIKGLTIHRIKFGNSKKTIDGFKKALLTELPHIIEKENPDCLFLTGGPFQILPVGRKMFELYKTPYYIDLRDPWSLQKIQGKTKISRIKSKMIRIRDSYYERKTFSKAKGIIVVNESMKIEYQKKYPQYSFHVITNGVDEEDFQKCKPIVNKEFTICYTGKFDVSAGFRDPSNFFKAISDIENIKFVHVGNKEEKVINLSKQYNCYNKCNFVGFKGYYDTISYQKGASLLLLISGNEPSEQTGKIFDYAFSNRPILVISNKNNEIYKICKELKNAYVVENNEKSIKETINKILNNPPKNVENNLKKYSRKELTKELINVIGK